MASIFSRIIKGEIPAYKLAETDDYLAFLDIFPLARGHALIIPKIETDYIFDLDEQTLGGILPFAQKVARAIEKVVPCERIGIAVLGLEVPHAHIHLVPINNLYDIDFSKPKLKLSEAEFESLASRIRREIGSVDLLPSEK